MGKMILSTQEIQMKQITTTLNMLLAGALVFILLSVVRPDKNVLAVQPSQQTEAAACSSSRSVHVSGTAIVNVIPDRALIHLGVQSNGATPSQVEAANEIERYPDVTCGAARVHT